MTILESERLLFRRLETSDFDALFELYRDPETRRYFPEGVLTPQVTRSERTYFVSGGDPQHPDLGLWATIHKPTGRFIGRCGLLPWVIDGILEVEAAYMIAKPVWRQGLGAEAAIALVKYGFDQLKLPRIIALIVHGNIASERTAKRAEFRFERSVENEVPPFSIYSIGKAAAAIN